MTRMQKILNKVLPTYLGDKRKFMCQILKEAWLSGEITWEDRKFATQEIESYLKHLGPYDTLECSLQTAGICSSKKAREQIYRNWAGRPITSPALEQKWIISALIYGLGIWEGLKTAEHAGDISRTQVCLVMDSISQFIERSGREPTRLELKDWATVCPQETN